MLLPIAYPIKTPRLYFFDKNGKPLIGGKIKTFKAGSKSDFAKTYRDAYRNASNQKTVKLDNAGSAFLYIFDAQRIEIYDKNDQFVERRFLPQTEYYSVFYDRYGKPLIGGKIYTYDIASTIKKTSYQDAEQTIPNPNPIFLDKNGGATICVAGSYRLRSYDAKNVFITDQDYKQENRFVLTSKVYPIDFIESTQNSFSVSSCTQRTILNEANSDESIENSLSLRLAISRESMNTYELQPQNTETHFSLNSAIQRTILNQIQLDSENLVNKFSTINVIQKTVLITHECELEPIQTTFSLLSAQIK